MKREWFRAARAGPFPPSSGKAMLSATYLWAPVTSMGSHQAVPRDPPWQITLQ